tara:strand:- start:8025 stop:8678 length:654 start_codon:yes stop_codon:yes gene_type:complete
MIHSYEFSWGFIPVANLKLYQKEEIHLNKWNYLTFDLNTIGPLKVIKNYDVSGGIRWIDNFSHEYFINGYDGGVLEDKLILITENKRPKILRFIDDKSSKPIESMSKNQIDPISSFLKLVVNYKYYKNCESNSFVYDGKRNLKIVSSKTKETASIIECQMNIDMSLLKDAQSKKWPFGKKNRYISFQFGLTGEEYPIKIKIDGPFGRIIGKKVLVKR